MLLNCQSLRQQSMGLVDVGTWGGTWAPDIAADHCIEFSMLCYLTRVKQEALQHFLKLPIPNSWGVNLTVSVIKNRLFLMGFHVVYVSSSYNFLSSKIHLMSAMAWGSSERASICRYAVDCLLDHGVMDTSCSNTLLLYIYRLRRREIK